MTKLKAIDPSSASTSKPKIVIFGKPGVQKTWVSLDFPSPYYIDTEGGANLPAYKEKLKNAKGVYFGTEQGSQNFEEVIEQVKALATEKHHFKTLIIDSFSKIFNIEIANEMERLGDKDAFGASKKPAVSKTRRLINWLDKVDMTVIIICHEKPVWLNDKQVGVTFDGYEKLEYELHLSLNIAKQGNTSKAYVKKTRLSGFGGSDSFEWSYKEFAERFGKDVIEAEAKPLVLATTAQIEQIKKLLDVVKLEEGVTDSWLQKAGATAWADMEKDKIEKCIKALTAKLPKQEDAI